MKLWWESMCYQGKSMNFGIKCLMPDLIFSFYCCVNLGKSLNFSMHQFSHLQNGYNDDPSGLCEDQMR